MKKLVKSLGLVATLFVLAACSSSKSSWKRLDSSQVDQKSYAIAYGATSQTYADRVNESYNIDAFMNGVNDWYEKKVHLPAEQIKANITTRLLDNETYAYYSGALFAAELRGKFNHLDPSCWNHIQVPSLNQGIHDAMLDSQKGKIRQDDYITKGAEEVLHLCVKTIAEDEKPAAKQAVKKSTKKANKAKARKK